MPNPNGHPATLRRWQPGQSANARGATRGYRRVLKESRKLSDEALQTVAACMRSEEAPWPSRLRAAEILLDRAWGQPDKHAHVEDVIGGGGTLEFLELRFVAPGEARSPANGYAQPERITFDPGRDIEGNETKNMG